jgi:hypothetical protein
MAEHLAEGPLVVVPVAAFMDIPGSELPILLRPVDPFEEPLGLFVLGHIEQHLHHADVVVDQMTLPVIDLLETSAPDPLGCRLPRCELAPQQFGMHRDDQHLRNATG